MVPQVLVGADHGANFVIWVITEYVEIACLGEVSLHVVIVENLGKLCVR